MEKHTIWKSDIDLEDWRDFLAEEGLENASDDEKWRRVYEMNAEYLEDERMNMNKVLEMPIVVIATLGLWHGTVCANKIMSTNLSDCLSFFDSCDNAEWFVEFGEFRSTQYHHDGMNRYIYRTIRDDLTEEERERIENDVISNAEAMRLTRSLAPEVCAIYGWRCDE